ncbi:polysaccharide biosynthesis/export family protein [Stigmatella aurantiaca]|uniref:Polysaccharide biosynthesis/export protein n=1 Tax=Stigmatella aurantiaca (strain DW4/3-1) TaxID=378806 RepID=Q098E0_STIAD|nr:polysaccharide biosynthesis/export family protein [Stigmatella aurantiaca]ADO71446.1 Polysaccharide biosynthesis/export protein [Stigmatella aurantiaca DW4/3-1]EAU68082.1 polysaccharide export protein [Stigmatella aurantiaca DW4/3-1]
MSKTRVRLWAVVGGLLLAGCSHKPALKVDNSDQPYRIGREDVLDIAVWRDGDLSRTLPVRPDGYISMPMTGDVLAAGKTPTELGEEIKERLKPYVQEPRVTVILREVNSSRVFVTGEVAHPGAYPLRGRVSLIQAIALAGGFTDFANSNGIVVIRNDGPEGQIPVRYSDLVSPKDTQELFLRPGDTIVVP